MNEEQKRAQIKAMEGKRVSARPVAAFQIKYGLEIQGILNFWTDEVREGMPYVLTDKEQYVDVYSTGITLIPERSQSLFDYLKSLEGFMVSAVPEGVFGNKPILGTLKAVGPDDEPKCYGLPADCTWYLEVEDEVYQVRHVAIHPNSVEPAETDDEPEDGEGPSSDGEPVVAMLSFGEVTVVRQMLQAVPAWELQNFIDFAAATIGGKERVTLFLQKFGLDLPQEPSETGLDEAQSTSSELHDVDIIIVPEGYAELAPNQILTEGDLQYSPIDKVWRQATGSWSKEGCTYARKLYITMIAEQQFNGGYGVNNPGPSSIAEHDAPCPYRIHRTYEEAGTVLTKPCSLPAGHDGPCQ